jgi:lipoyl-dependent peroxiredoxin
MQREANAVWSGGLKDGRGNLTTASGALKAIPYSFAMRFEEAPGTNPEELIAAAHAGCFSMALSGQLGAAGLTAERIDTRALVTLEKTDAGFTVTRSALTLRVRVPGADRAKVQAAADAAKAGCPISRLLNATVTLETTIET